MPQKYLAVDGTATLIHHRGSTTLPGSPPDTTTGATVICLHDAGTGGGWFDDLLDHLDAHSPMAYDQPGHGRSGGLDSLDSVEAMAAQLRALAATWSLTDVVLVGEGLGAAVALQAATDDPGFASALVLIGGAAASFELAAEIDSLAAITAGKARREFDRTGYAPDTERAVYQQAFGHWVKTDPRATLGARRAQAAWALADPPPATPTLVVVGEHEEEASVAAATSLVERLPGATLHRLDGAGRRGAIEQPAALAAAIASFIGDRT